MKQKIIRKESKATEMLLLFFDLAIRAINPAH